MRHKHYHQARKPKLHILYEDKDIIVCKKPHGIPTQTKQPGAVSMEHLLKNHLFSQNPAGGEPYLAVIHRLDQPVSGILVFAKNKKAAAALNRQLSDRSSSAETGFGKYYRAEVQGVPEKEEDDLVCYMVRDGRTNTSRICSPDTKDAKEARLHYKIISTAPDKRSSLLEIHLDTGRHHQIRVQLAGIGHPILGDTKYNSSASAAAKEKNGWQELKLCAFRLKFRHPSTGEPMMFILS